MDSLRKDLDLAYEKLIKLNDDLYTYTKLTN